MLLKIVPTIIHHYSCACVYLTYIELLFISGDQDTTLESCSCSVVISVLTAIAILLGLVIATIIAIIIFYKERKRKPTMATSQDVSVTRTYIPGDCILAQIL